MKIFAPIFLLFFLSWQTAQAQERPLIVASINPIYQIILAITKDKSNNVLIMSPSVSEHDYNLKKNDVKAINDADLIFFVSADLEKNFPSLIKSQNKNLRAFELSKINGIKLLQLRNDAKKTDPHIWLNPQNAIKIAEFVTKKIAEIDVKNSAQYYKNLEKFQKEVMATEKTIKLRLAKIESPSYISFHDGYQYFENYFALKPLKVIANSHDSELAISDVKEIDLLANQAVLKCFIGEKWDEKNTAKKLAKNYQLKFFNTDSLGGASYQELLLKIADGISQCE
jgi:zinc transport system substrate-binding protein